VDSSVLNKKCLESLILNGAFDELGANRHQLMVVYPTIVKVLMTDKKATDSGQISLFDTVLKQDDISEVKMPDTPEYDDMTKLKFEREMVGMYLSGHPLQQYAKAFEQFNFDTGKIRKRTNNGEDAESEMQASEEEAETTFENNQPVSMGAIITEVKKVLTKATKKEMAVIKIEDMYGACEIMIFPNLFDKCRNVLIKDAIVRINGKLSVREGEDPIVLADNIELLEGTAQPETPAEPQAAAKLYVKYNTADKSIHEEVTKIFEAYSGDLPVVVKCTASNQALQPKQKVRDCRAIVYELVNLLGEQNVIMK
jgi:DNA polymerase-3 subunit alpha